MIFSFCAANNAIFSNCFLALLPVSAPLVRKCVLIVLNLYYYIIQIKICIFPCSISLHRLLTLAVKHFNVESHFSQVVASLLPHSSVKSALFCQVETPFNQT